MKENNGKSKEDNFDGQAEFQEKTGAKTCCRHHRQDHCCGFNFGKLLFGLLLIGFGLVFFARALGLLSFNLNISWAYIWPLLIVLFGLSLLSRGNWVATLIGTVVSLVVLAVLGMMILGAMPGTKHLNYRGYDFFEKPWLNSSPNSSCQPN